MRVAYRVLGNLIAGLIMIQAALIAFADFGLNQWIDQGGTLTKAAVEASRESGELPFTGVLGYIFHGIIGQYVIPIVALLLLVVSFFANVTKGVLLAGIVLGLVIVQVVLGLNSTVPALGPLHGLNAFAIFAMAMVAAARAKTTSVDATTTAAARA